MSGGSSRAPGPGQSVFLYGCGDSDRNLSPRSTIDVLNNRILRQLLVIANHLYDTVFSGVDTLYVRQTKSSSLPDYTCYGFYLDISSDDRLLLAEGQLA